MLLLNWSDRMVLQQMFFVVGVNYVMLSAAAA